MYITLLKKALLRILLAERRVIISLEASYMNILLIIVSQTC